MQYPYFNEDALVHSAKYLTLWTLSDFATEIISDYNPFNNYLLLLLCIYKFSPFKFNIIVVTVSIALLQSTSVSMSKEARWKNNVISITLH